MDTNSVRQTSLACGQEFVTSRELPQTCGLLMNDVTDKLEGPRGGFPGKSKGRPQKNLWPDWASQELSWDSNPNLSLET